MWKILKSIFRIILLLFAVIGIGIVGTLAVEAYFFSKGDPEGKKVADEWIPAIVAEWNYDQLKGHLSDNFMITVSTTQGSVVTQNFTGKDTTAAKQLFDKAKTALGNMKNYNGAECKGMNLMLICTASVQFEHGDAGIIMGLSKQGNERKIVMFNINSAALAK